jgi:hypothetical protein
MNKYEHSKSRKIGFFPGSPVLLAELVAVLSLGTASAQTSQPSTESASSGTGSELDQVGAGSLGFPNAPRTYGVELPGKFR